MLPLDWANRVLPKAGYLLVEREPEPAQWGMIWKSPTYVDKMRTPVAEVLAIGKGVDPGYAFKVGQRVTVSGIGGEFHRYGEGDAERVLYLISPATVLLISDEPVQVERDARSATFVPLEKSEAELSVELGRAEHGVRT